MLGDGNIETKNLDFKGSSTLKQIIKFNCKCWKRGPEMNQLSTQPLRAHCEIPGDMTEERWGGGLFCVPVVAFTGARPGLDTQVG